MKKILLLNFLIALSFSIANAQRGKDLSKTVVGTEVVNSYTNLTIDASIGDAFITVANSNLSNNFSGNLSSGDLIMIIQVQGVFIEDTIATPLALFGNSSKFFNTWGRITDYKNCGNYEFVQVASVPNSTTINLDCNLNSDYTALGNVVILRVPRYTSLSIPIGTSLTANPWNGSTGGILAVEVNGNTSIDGIIDVSNIGFRGGQPENSSIGGGQRFADSNPLEGGEKGEGIAGDQNLYDSFNDGGARYCKGAAANAGGGGTSVSSGGGGGANAGDILNWSNGVGIPNPAYNAAWALEAISFPITNASGGGKGGYTATGPNNGNGLLQGPNHPIWGGDNRRNNGGLGGRPLDYSTGKIFIGGAGGAGDGNASSIDAGAGGKGGGIIFISSYGNVSGTGSILANGQDGFNSGSSAPASPFTLTGSDGAGGGGAGGTVIIKTIGSVNNVNINSNGGKGGLQIIRSGFGTQYETEGPGGGGGGGYIAITSGSPSRTANGGTNGTTDSPHLTEFPPNGATSGGIGKPNESIDVFDFSISGVTTLCTNDSTLLTSTFIGTTPLGAITEWYDSSTGGTLLFTGNSFSTSSLSLTTTYYAKVCPAPFRVPVTITVNPCLPITANFSASDSIICLGDCINFSDLSSGSSPIGWTWYFPGADSTSSNLPNPTNICYNNIGNFNVSLIVTDGSNTDSLFFPNFITVNALPNIIAGNDTSICLNNTAYIYAVGANSYNWNNSLGMGNNFLVNPLINTTFIVNGIDTNGCINTDSTIISINPLPNITANATINPICPGDTVSLYGTGSTSYTWDNNVTNGLVFTPTNTTLYMVTGTDLNNCQNTDTLTLIINSCLKPAASFETSSSSICINECVDFSDLITGGIPSNWSWYFFGANPNISNNQNPSNICYDSTGIFDVALIVSNTFGNDSIYLDNYITVDSCFTTSPNFIIPNVFSPNGDGQNDLFQITGTGLAAVKVNIYNRWGNLLFSSDNLTKKGWDGRTSSGTICPSGTYFYIVTVDLDSEIKPNKGTFTLLR